jgi:cytochrome P450
MNDKAPETRDLLAQLFTPDYIRNPYPALEKLREYAALIKVPDSAMWLATRYAEVSSILRDKRFGHAYEERMIENMGPEIFSNAAYYFLNQTMLLKDPPDHKRIRGLAVKAFSAARIEAMRSRIQSIVDELLDQLEPKGHGDLILEFAHPLPVIVICDMLGIPEDEREQFLAGSNISGRLIDPTPLTDEELAQENENTRNANDYFLGLCEKRRQEPEDDLITALVQAETDDGKLNQDELTANIALLFAAGHETTVNLIGNGLVALFNHSDQLDKLKSDYSLIPNAIEEFLRFDSSVQFSSRVALEDVEVAGTMVRKHEEVLTSLGSANHDPGVYDNPDTLDITRKKIKPLSFGGGIHTCLGAQLARIEAAIAFESILRRFPNLQLDSVDDPDWKPTITLRGLKTLPASW